MFAILFIKFPTDCPGSPRRILRFLVWVRRSAIDYSLQSREIILDLISRRHLLSKTVWENTNMHTTKSLSWLTRLRQCFGTFDFTKTCVVITLGNVLFVAWVHHSFGHKICRFMWYCNLLSVAVVPDNWFHEFIVDDAKALSDSPRSIWYEGSLSAKAEIMNPLVCSDFKTNHFIRRLMSRACLQTIASDMDLGHLISWTH